MRYIMAIKPKERELAAIGISVVAGCKPCTDFHIKVARKARASDEEIRRAVADALQVRRSATEIMERYALAHLSEAGREGDAEPTGETDRTRELVCVGAAFGVNCVSNLEQHLAAAEAVGISQEEIATIGKLAAMIKDRAASHVEVLLGMRQEQEGEQTKAEATYEATFASG
jgi:AhpD family alkylhydroperoxidase